MDITLGYLNATFHSTELSCRCDIREDGHVTTKFFHIGLKFLWQWRLRVLEKAAMTMHVLYCKKKDVSNTVTAALLAQLGERRSAEREVVSSNPGRTINPGL